MYESTTAHANHDMKVATMAVSVGLVWACDMIHEIHEHERRVPHLVIASKSGRCLAALRA